jgi:hypothetical protein
MDSMRTTFFERGSRALCILILTAAGFVLPAVPSLGLDSAWQMALGRFFIEGRQFGTEVVFTYGPLGWTMGNMYWGQQWGALVAWHAIFSACMAALITWNAFQLPVPRRVVFLIFFILLGLRHEDIQQQLAIAMAGFELIRRADRPWQRGWLLFIAVLAVLSLVKFTNLVLATVIIGLASARPLLRRDWRMAWRAPVCFAGLFLVGWLVCGQNPANLPAYFLNSWVISSGYQDAMGWSCPSVQLYHGLAVAGILVTYLAANALTDSDRPRGGLLALAAAAYLFLNWKHGFIRADGHQLVFYFAALGLTVGSPLLLGDAPRWRLPKQILLVVAAVLALRGAELATPGLLPNLWANLQARLGRHLDLAMHPVAFRAKYDEALDAVSMEVPLPLTRQVVGERPLDVIGFEQDVVLLNQFNHVARPVFQSYSAYTPRLARMNREFFESSRAPEFVLFKLQTIDGRLETMDDSLVIDLLPQHYRYLFTERGFSLWQRQHPTNAPLAHPTPARTVRARLDESISLADLRDQSVWVRVESRLNLLGRLRRLLFKPPQLHLVVTDESGATTRYRLPAPLGETGFLVSPLVRDISEFLRAANGEPGRRIVSLGVESSSQDRDCFHDELKIELSTVSARPGAGWAALPLGDPDFPLNFVRGEAPFGAQLSRVDGTLEYYAHAPATLVYRPAHGAKILRGEFGFYDGAHAATNQSPTDGAEFTVRWRPADGPETVLFQRQLNPRENQADRGRQGFEAALPADLKGELEFVINPGPSGNSASDWTYWRDLRLENSL